MDKQELLERKTYLEARYQELKAKNLNLDISRGKPETRQLDLSMDLFDTINSTSILVGEDGIDLRNYSTPNTVTGITEGKRLLASMSGVSEENVIVYGNASLNIMYDTISRAVTHGVLGETPWCKLDKVKFLCPVPGYDRHFAITEHFGIDMINISMTDSGPDMDRIEALVSADDSIKGIWCTPKYSNPSGDTYADETVIRFANIKPAAKDFRIFWDNAYCIHHLYEDDQDYIRNILTECEKAGNPDLVYMFFSTSKVSFGGAGISGMAISKANKEEIEQQLKVQTIGHDKINQLRHALYFKDIDGLNAHMKKHAEILRPKFKIIEEALEKELAGSQIASFNNPKGGYFISFNAMEGCAKSIVEKCKEAGVVLTAAGSTFPYGKDPKDSNIRLAPSFAPLEDLAVAMEVFIVSTKLVSIDKLLINKMDSMSHLEEETDP